MRWLWLLGFVAAGGCVDTFVLPISIDGPVVDLHLPPADDLGGDGPASDGGMGDGGGTLPASCALLPCTPALNEGDVALTNVTIKGCHAYRALLIGSDVTVGREGGVGFAACAESIVVSGPLDANGRGENGGSGVGAGRACGSGGGHGGAGADPGACGGGGTYGDPLLPRAFGSGGGGDGGGEGGGAIELAATGQLQLFGRITANGAAGRSLASGGGSGGSVLLRAATIVGGGQVHARGGAGVGIAGGGGGGRVAIYGDATGTAILVDVQGGDALGGKGGTGSVVRLP